MTTLIFNEYHEELTPPETAHIESYEDALRAYISYIPVNILSKRVKNIRDVINNDGWQQLRAKKLLDSVSLSDIATELPDIVKVTVLKLNLIKYFVGAKTLWANSLYLHTLKEKVENYTLKVKLADYSKGDWDSEVWGVSIIDNDINTLVDINWVLMLDSADDKDIEVHTKVLMDKLELQKSMKVKLPYKNPQAHLDRCKKLKIDPTQYDEQFVLDKYEFIYGEMG